MLQLHQDFNSKARKSLKALWEINPKCEFLSISMNIFLVLYVLLSLMKDIRVIYIYRVKFEVMGRTILEHIEISLNS